MTPPKMTDDEIRRTIADAARLIEEPGDFAAIPLQVPEGWPDYGNVPLIELANEYTPLPPRPCCLNCGRSEADGATLREEFLHGRDTWVCERSMCRTVLEHEKDGER